MHWEHETHAAIRDGDWKLVTLDGTDEAAWELYDIGQTRTETNNLANKQPELVEQLKARWIQWARQANALPWPKDRN